MVCARRRRILYFEPDLRGGHKVVFMDHVANHAMASGTNVEVIFAAGRSPELGRLSWWRDAMACRLEGVSAIELPAGMAQACCSTNLAWRGILQARIASRVAAAQEAHSILFGWIDQALFGIAARQVGLPCSGILFRSPDMTRRGRRTDWKVAPKTALCLAALLNRRLQRVHCLDQCFVHGFNAAFPRSTPLLYLPDPVVPTDVPANGPLAKPLARARAEGRRIYLAIGGIDGRKGVVQFLAALRALNSRDASRVALTIAGRVAPEFKEQLQTAVAETRLATPALTIDVLDRFLDDEEYRWLLDRADVVLVLYQSGHRGSSGTLVQAVAAGKPVIGSSEGLIGHEIAQNGLGWTVDAGAPESIARMVEADLRSKPALERRVTARYLAGRSPVAFASALLQPTNDEGSCSKHARSAHAQ